MVYLLCFHSKYKHAKHYIGFTETAAGLDKRMERHRKGQGARLIEVITKAGIGFDLVRTWPDGDRNFERKLKNRKKASQLCPRCKVKPATFSPVLTLDTETCSIAGEAQTTLTIDTIRDSYNQLAEQRLSDARANLEKRLAGRTNPVLMELARKAHDPTLAYQQLEHLHHDAPLIYPIEIVGKPVFQPIALAQITMDDGSTLCGEIYDHPSNRLIMRPFKINFDRLFKVVQDFLRGVFSLKNETQTNGERK